MANTPFIMFFVCIIFYIAFYLYFFLYILFKVFLFNLKALNIVFVLFSGINGMFSVFLLALALSVDAFAVAFSYGLVIK